MAEVVEHHRARPDLPDRVGDPLPRDVGGGPVHGLEHRRVLPLRVEVRGGGDADRARDGGAEIGQDVAEQVAPHDHVEPVRMEDEVRGEDVHVVLRRAHVGVPLRHRREALVPVGHGVDDAVRLRCGGEAPGLARAGQLERVLEHPVHPPAGEHALLHGHLVVGPLVEAPADLGVLALVVLADDVEVDVLGAPAAERRLHAREHPHRPQVDVLAEPAADRDEEAPERYVVGHPGEPHRPEEDRVEPGEAVEPVGGHHPAFGPVRLAAPGEVLPGEVDPVAAGRGLHRPDPLRRDFPADPVSGDDGDSMAAHVRGLAVRLRSDRPRRRAGAPKRRPGPARCEGLGAGRRRGAATVPAGSRNAVGGRKPE